MKLIVFGGDGFCGWPTSLYLSAKGCEVLIADNFARRKIDVELECESLTPIKSLGRRLETWQKVSGRQVRAVNLDVANDYGRLLNLLSDECPDAIIHFAEQRSAPYSMRSPAHKRYTVNNNLNATNNLLCAIVEAKLDAHFVHLGTMGVYGYSTSGLEIPEGYLDISIPQGNQAIKSHILYPANPGSIYHMTKTQDALFFQFYNKNDGVRITDLHQGVVWGTNIKETLLHEDLVNRFDYDGDFGTVLNRFLVQAAVGFPLTVYGTGGQTRAFIHINDTVRCIEIALNNPPKNGEPVHIFNQTTETHRVRDLAQLVSELTGAAVQKIDNPRIEAEENDLKVANRRFLELGLKPTTLEKGLLEEISDVAKRYAVRCDQSKILPSARWRT